MAAKRSPILGYNHNVRYRGIVFHVQTEDSGLQNPHVFTHLFHGGVIISTRKLVYDRDASEDAVKSLMQAQHKAVMKDLKNLVFDDKIDQYLVNTPGLLPRGVGVGVEPVVEASGPVPAPPVVPRVETQDPTPPAAVPPRAPTNTPMEVDVAPTIPVEMPLMPGGDALGRAPTERVGQADLAMLESELPPSTGTPPVLERAEISAAMASIQVGDDELAAAGLVEVADVAEVHSPAPPSTPPPPGAASERPGQYSVSRRSDRIEALPRPPIPSPQARPTPPPSSKLPASGPLPPRAQTPPVVPPRAPTPASGPLLRPTPTSVPRLPTPGRAADQALPPSTPRPPTAPVPPRTPTPVTPAPARGRPGAGGGVVVSRPPVIVGGPSKSVGTPAGQGKVRRAKETDGGIGGDLISERSLDEVILAYLSEDTSDE